MSSINLIEPPKEVFGRPVNIAPSRVVGEIVPKRRPSKFHFEKIDLVQKEDDTCPHKPPRVDNGIEKDKTLHHSILTRISMRQVHICQKVSLDCSPPTKPGHIRSRPHRK